MCVPSGCSHSDIEVVLRESLANFTQGLRFKVQVRVEEEMCQVAEPPLSKVDRNTIYAAAFFAIFFVIALGMTCYDHYVPESPQKSEKKNLLQFLLKFTIFSSSRRVADHVLPQEERRLFGQLEARGQ